MAPKKNKKQKDIEDELDKAEQKSKWATLLQDQHDEDEADATALYSKADKTVFNYDFSNQKLLYKEKQPVKKEVPKIELTQEQKQKLEERLEKQRLEREAKQKIKREKKLQKKKILQQQKQSERQKKEEIQRQEQEVKKKVEEKKQPISGRGVFLVILIGVVIFSIMSYQRELYLKLSKFKLDTTIDYYSILETDSGVTDAELKEKYKKLVLKYHPDKNPNCASCKQKFNTIMKAWQILGNPEKKQSYDQNSGYITQIKSQSLTLTPNNYDALVTRSDQLWVIQVYDSLLPYCHSFAPFWQDLVLKYKHYINFGRIDIERQSEMKSYIPYKFQIFPGIYTVHKGEEKMCQLSYGGYESPIRSVQQCIDSHYDDSIFNKIQSVDQIKSQGKKAVILGGKISRGIKLNIISSKYDKYFDFYSLPGDGKTATIKDSDKILQFNELNKKMYRRYESFLSAHILQKKTICQLAYFFQDKPCIIMLEKQAPFPNQLNYPVITIQDPQFRQTIQELKNSTGLLQKFDLGLYQGGKIDLGYSNQIDTLNPQNGQTIELVCVHKTLLDWLLQAASWIASLFT